MRRPNDLYLCHHGIKGMKWGVRRYQNPDGSLTSAGKKRVLKNLKTEQEQHFRKQISPEASKVTRYGANGYEQRGSDWNSAYRKGRVNSRDDKQITAAAKETRDYMVNKYGKELMSVLAKSRVLISGSKAFDEYLNKYGWESVKDLIR